MHPTHILSLFEACSRALIWEGVANLQEWIGQKCGIPTSDSERLSEEWFEKHLRKVGILNENDEEEKFNVVKVRETPFTNHRGLRAPMTRVVVMVEVVTKKETSLNELSFVAKRSRRGFSSRLQAVTGEAWREARFLASSYGGIVKDMTPQLLHADWNSSSGNMLLISRDVRDEANPSYNFVESSSEDITVPHLRAIFRSAARLHAQTWRDESLLSTPWMKGALWYQGRGRGVWEGSLARAKQFWANAKRNFVVNKHATVRFEATLVDIVDRSLEESSWQALQDHLKDPQVPFMLCHGDFHAANILIREEDEKKSYDWKMYLVDWSEVGPWEGVVDLAQLMISNVRPEISRRRGRELVTEYWKQLMELGVKEADYPFELAWRSYCREGCARWIFLFSLLAGMDRIPPERIQHFHDQLWAFIQEHGMQRRYLIKTLVCVP